MSQAVTATINSDDAEEYTQGLSQIGAGWWRQIALGVRLGVPNALGLSTRDWVEQRLGGYMRQSIPERKEAAKELDAEGMDQEEIADVLGVSQPTVSRDLTPEPKPYSSEYDDEAEADESQVDEPPIPDSYSDEYESGIPAQESQKESKSPNGQVNEGDEWYTPRWLFNALGLEFSIDVCAPLNRTYSAVPAQQHYTIETDGLDQPWIGTVWCNPPYSKPEPWARRMIHHGDGLLLTHMPMNAGWCVDVWDTCDAIRLFQAMEFVRPNGTNQRPGYWLQLAAFGGVSTEALARLQPFGDAAANKRRIASPMWRRVS